MKLCQWCGKRKSKFSDWEQLGRRDEYFPLCVPCANKRLKNMMNVMVPMRRVECLPSENN